MSGQQTCAAIVTGASGGIGRAVVSALMESKYFVVGVDLDASGARPSSTEYAQVTGDVRDPAVRESVLQHLRQRALPVRSLVTASLAQSEVSLLDTTAADRHASWTVMIDAAWEFTQLFAAVAQSPAAIVHVASVHVFGAQRGFAAYSASKAALVALTRSTATELGETGIRCNAVAPGFIGVDRNRRRWETQTELARVANFNPLARLGRPEDVAAVIAFLLSDAAAHVNGVCLPVDGGQVARLARGSNDD